MVISRRGARLAKGRRAGLLMDSRKTAKVGLALGGFATRGLGTTEINSYNATRRCCGC
ncbi:hypothetical protein TIFTF001_044016 [Ficus carica]|nr:hypothetical protein TIFTF001_044015 [Ficus carica]GMN26603.1 hypothetical protein TIFTF001_044016 [Ficus carica]